MKVFITDITVASAFVIPVVPANFQIKSEKSFEINNTLEGYLAIIGNRALRTVEWSSFFPVDKNYSFVTSHALKNGWAYVAFIEYMKKIKLPLRIIVTTDTGIPILNILAVIGEFEYSVDRAGDIKYSIILTEFSSDIMQLFRNEKMVFSGAGKLVKERLAKLKKFFLVKKD